MYSPQFRLQPTDGTSAAGSAVALAGKIRIRCCPFGITRSARRTRLEGRPASLFRDRTKSSHPKTSPIFSTHSYSIRRPKHVTTKPPPHTVSRFLLDFFRQHARFHQQLVTSHARFSTAQHIEVPEKYTETKVGIEEAFAAVKSPTLRLRARWNGRQSRQNRPAVRC